MWTERETLQLSGNSAFPLNPKELEAWPRLAWLRFEKPMHTNVS